MFWPSYVCCADEGRMKGLAFAYDPDGYWIELVSRNKEAGHPEKYNLGQTMIRIKNVDKSLDFYTGEGGMGMTKVSKRPYPRTNRARRGFMPCTAAFLRGISRRKSLVPRRFCIFATANFPNIGQIRFIPISSYGSLFFHTS